MSIKNFFKKEKKINPGLYDGRININEENHRAHLRIESDNSGIATIDASRILHLNQTGAEIVFWYLQNLSKNEILKKMRNRYMVKKANLKNDIERVTNTIEILSATDRVCPLSDLGIEIIEPYSKELSAPLRMDIALTYRCQNKCGHCYNEPERTVKEIDVNSWKEVMKKCFLAGIPHVVFTGGEPTLRDDLPDLIAYAEELGIVTGLNTNGRRLADKKYTERLKNAGLDHVQITLESADKNKHDNMTGASSFDETLEGLRASLAEGLFTITNTTLIRMNAEKIEDIIGLLEKEGIKTFAINGMIYSGKGKISENDLQSPEIIPILERVAKRAREKNMRFIWYTPTRYCELNPVEMALGVKQCTAARISMAIEPDGAVIPCQSYYKSVGNIITDPWDKIWNNPLCIELRKPQKPLQECEACEHLSLCGGGCPLMTDHERLYCREAASGA